MAPIRRYLRITKTSALEVRIYLEKPSDLPWLLSSRDPALPRIIKLIHPKILPKLREENENSKRKGSKKRKNIKDVASQADFEVALFLTDSSTRHSLITKQKQFVDKPRIRSTSRALTGWLDGSKSDRIDLSSDDDMPILRREDTEVSMNMDDIPKVGADDDEVLSVESSDGEVSQPQRLPGNQHRIVRATSEEDSPPPEDSDDKKKMALNTSYDSFSIYGKILCLIVKRRGVRGMSATVDKDASVNNGTHMVEHWVSTQADMAPDLDNDND